MRLFFLLVLLTAACPSMAIHAEGNWPRFRGPNADGVAPDNADPPTTWTTTDNVKWVADVPGWGWSCPIVWGDRVFLTSVLSDEENLTPSKGLYLGEGVRDPAKGNHHWMVYCFGLNTGKGSGASVPRGPANTPARTFDALEAEDWHQWRGPEANGVSRTATPPIEWSETKNVKWKVVWSIS